MCERCFSHTLAQTTPMTDEIGVSLHTMKPCYRWYWSLKINGSTVALPRLIAQAVECHIVQHRRERKVLWLKKPCKWEKKLEAVNAINTIVYDLKQGALATAKYLKRSVTKMNGQLEFLGKGRGHEMLRIKFVLHGDGSDPAGPGAYWLYSNSFEAREICCVSTTAERSGFDLLREAYAGLIIMLHFSCLKSRRQVSSSKKKHTNTPKSYLISIKLF